MIQVRCHCYDSIWVGFFGALIVITIRESFVINISSRSRHDTSQIGIVTAQKTSAFQRGSIVFRVSN